MAKKQPAAQPASTNPAVTFNGKSYELSSLPQDLQDFISIHQTWTGELANSRREVFKIEAALRGLLSEMEIRFKAIEDSKKGPE